MTRLVPAIAMFLVALWSTDAFAGCKCDKRVKPVSGSKMIFFGKATEIKPRGAQDRVSFEITQTYKGDEEREVITVYTNRFEHDCGFRFEVDKTYMVYGKDFYPRGIATSVCWGTYATDDPVEGDAWKNVKVNVPEETDLEKKLREIAKPLVIKCANKFRVGDAGFSMVLSPDGDPVRPPLKGGQRAKVVDFKNCVGEAFLESDDLPRPKEAVEIQGWYQKEIKAFPVLLDRLPCPEGCPDWVTRVKTPLLDPDGPEPTDKISFNLKAEWEQCLTGGIEAVGPESHGAESAKRRRDRMLADCAAKRSEFDLATPYIDGIENAMVARALEWGAKKTVPEGAKTAYPIGTGTPSFPAEAIKGELTSGKFRIVRAGFLDDERWSMSPIYLEAFAESIIADKASPPAMLDLAALAYHRAGKLLPEAAEGYAKLAKKASSRPEAEALRGELDKIWTDTFAPPVEVAPEVELPPEVPQVQEEAPQGQDPMLLVVAGVLIVVAIAGIATILKRRSS